MKLEVKMSPFNLFALIFGKSEPEPPKASAPPPPPVQINNLNVIDPRVQIVSDWVQEFTGTYWFELVAALAVIALVWVVCWLARGRRKRHDESPPKEVDKSGIENKCEKMDVQLYPSLEKYADSPATQFNHAHVCHPPSAPLPPPVSLPQLQPPAFTFAQSVQLRRNVQPFEPTFTNQDPLVWLEKFEVHAFAQSAADKFKLLLASIDSKFAVEIARLVPKEAFDAYEKAKQELLLLSGHEKGDAEEKFYSERQGPDNNGYFYRCRLVELALKAFPNTDDETREALIRRQFIMGLKSDRIRSKLIESDEKSMSKILDIVKVSERSTTPPPPEPLFIQMNQAVFQNQPRHGQMNDDQRFQTLNQIKCWNCLSYGHKARSCPNDRQGLPFASGSGRRPAQ